MARTWVVSWLRAVSLTFPDPCGIQWYRLSGRVLLPVTVAGPRRFCTGFRVPRSHFDCARSLRQSVPLGKLGAEPPFELRALQVVLRLLLLSGIGDRFIRRIKGGNLLRQ